MNEFELIDVIVAGLGDTAASRWLDVGAGDDASVSTLPAGTQLVSSIDTLVAGRHFPGDADPADIGFRAMMVSLSDLAAMGAEPHIVLVALTLEAADPAWVSALARGMAEAARQTGATIAGGNLSRGRLSLSMSVHGVVPEGTAVLRSGARPGDLLYVTGALGGAAAALASGFARDDLNACFFRPAARVDLAPDLRAIASAAIDVSDGLLQDAAHLAAASGVCLDIESARVPVQPGAQLQQALRGGDDYELCFAAASPPPFDAVCIGRVVDGTGVLLDGAPVVIAGYQHFA